VGLTRVSIDLHKSIFRSVMDCRVEPGNDGWGRRNYPARKQLRRQL
jgi:hypothetical protein